MPTDPVFKRSRHRRLLAALCLCCVRVDLLAQPGKPDRATDTAAVLTAPVELDGELLFRVRGHSALPAEERAEQIATRIGYFAGDSSVAPGAVRVQEEDNTSKLIAGERLLMIVSDSDSAVEGVARSDLAKALADRIGRAAQAYREARSSQSLLKGLALAILATAIVIGISKLGKRYSRRLEGWIYRHTQSRMEKPRLQALGIIRVESVLAGLGTTFKILRTAAAIAIGFLYIQTVLALFPWTKPISQRFFSLFMDPLANMGTGILKSLPDLVFLVVLFVVVRYGLRILSVLFDGIQSQTIRIGELDPELAAPTFRIVRFGILAFALVVAYPYLPGSGSEAFKGVTLFLGILFSLGSTSAIANSIAGYALTYRRAYKIGDTVRVDNMVGHVEKLRTQVTHLRSDKNEEIIIPNSLILNTTVVNYSSLAKERGLIIHASVTLDYRTPWRRVEALLLEAAGRTEGLLRQPPPFVLQPSLVDLGVVYELNAYCDRPDRMVELQTELHRQMLDVLNENGVQWPEVEHDTRPMSLNSADTVT